MLLQMLYQTNKKLDLKKLAKKKSRAKSWRQAITQKKKSRVKSQKFVKDMILNMNVEIGEGKQGFWNAI